MKSRQRSLCLSRHRVLSSPTVTTLCTFLSSNSLSFEILVQSVVSVFPETLTDQGPLWKEDCITVLFALYIQRVQLANREIVKS